MYIYSSNAHARAHTHTHIHTHTQTYIHYPDFIEALAKVAQMKYDFSDGPIQVYN